jgi:hypothetical protein
MLHRRGSDALLRLRPAEQGAKPRGVIVHIQLELVQKIRSAHLYKLDPNLKREKETEAELKKEQGERWRSSEHIGEQTKKEKDKFHKKHENTKND